MSDATTPASTPAPAAAGSAATPAPAPAAAASTPAPAAPVETKTDAKATETKKDAPPAKEKAKLPPPLVTKDAAPAEKTEAAPPKELGFELDLPEGFDATAAGTLRALAAELELDKPKAQKIVQKYLQAAEAAEAAREEQFVAQANAYVKAAAEHEAVKGLGGLDRARTLASRALAKFDTGGELGEALQASGLAYHPGVLLALARVGATLSEDTTRGATGAPPSAQKDPRFALYTHPTSRSMFKE